MIGRRKSRPSSGRRNERVAVPRSCRSTAFCTEIETIGPGGAKSEAHRRHRQDVIDDRRRRVTSMKATKESAAMLRLTIGMMR